MKHADTYKCPCCGAGVNILYGKNNAACEYCGNRITVPLDNEEYAAILGTIRDALSKEQDIGRTVRQLENEIVCLDTNKTNLRPPRKMKKEVFVVSIIDASTLLLFIILSTIFYKVWEEGEIELWVCILVLSLIILVGELASFICYKAIKQSIEKKVSKIESELGG